MISRHPDPQWLVEYSTGTLATAQAIAVSTHLQFCETCRSAASSLDQLGGELLDSLQPVPVSAGLLDTIIHCIDEGAHADAEATPEPPVDSLDSIASSLPDNVRRLLPPGDLDWGFLSPSLRLATISVGEDRFELALHRIKAGGKAPHHDHRGEEVTVVLTGCFSDEDGLYQPGDFIVRNPGDSHRPMAAQNAECICLSVLAAPISLRGAWSILNPFLQFNPS